MENRQREQAQKMYDEVTKFEVMLHDNDHNHGPTMIEEEGAVSASDD